MVICAAGVFYLLCFCCCYIMEAYHDHVCKWHTCYTDHSILLNTDVEPSYDLTCFTSCLHLLVIELHAYLY